MQINISGWGAFLLAVVLGLGIAMLVAPDATASYINGLADAVTGV